MIERTRLIAALQIDLEFLEKLAERLFSLIPRVTDPTAKQGILDLAKETEDKAADIRERIQDFEGSA